MTERRAPRRWVLRFAIGLLVVVGVAEVAARVAESAGPPALRWYDATTQLKVEQMESREQADVVFVGTSSAAQGLVPSVFSANDTAARSAYNAGLAGAVPAVTEPWLLDQVVPRLQPSLVVWGLNSLDFSPSWGVENLERYRDALAVREGPLATIERGMSGISALVRYRSVMRRPSAIFGDEVSSDFDEAAAILGDDGERLEFSFGRGEQRAEIIASRLWGYDIDRADVNAVVRSVRALRDRGVKVLLVELPIPDRMVEQHPNGEKDVELAHLTIQAIADVLEVEALDLRSGFTDRDFVDFTHLDRGPARELTANLVAALEAPEPDPEPGQEPVEPESEPGPEPGDTVTEAERRLAREVATRAIEITDTLYHYLLGGADDAGRSEFWYGKIHHHYGRARDLAVAHAEGKRFEVLFVGSSMMVNAADPEGFTALDGRTSFNAAMPRVGPEVIDLWLEQQALPWAQPDMVVYGVAPRDVRALDDEPGTCRDSTADWDEAAALREDAFAPIASLEGADPDVLFFGDPPATFPSRRVPVHQSYVAEYSRLGNRIVFDRASDDELAETVEILRGWAENFDLCQERLDQIADTVRRLTDRGITVVMVGMPIRDARADAFGGGRAGVEAILLEIARTATDAGAAAFLDISDLLPDERFRDLAHVDYRGAQAFTLRLVEELARLGL